MKKGFFNTINEENYYLLENLSINQEKIDALYFLHGICHQFSLALNEIYGYNIVLWINYDEDIESNVLIHAFNTFVYEGKQYYVDVRGITDDINCIIDGFDYSEEIINSFGINKQKAKYIINSLGLNTEVINDIYKVIDAYKSYYQLID